MSQTFSLVCHETKQRVWIGQGWGSMRNFYTGEPETMEALKRFLNDHIDKPIVFVCDDLHDAVYEYNETAATGHTFSEDMTCANCGVDRREAGAKKKCEKAAE